MHDVQNLGAVQTYLRRYLYVAAFEIVEADQIDKTHNENAPKQGTKASQNTEKVTPIIREPIDVLTAKQREEVGALVKTSDDKVAIKKAITDLGYQMLSEVKQSDFAKLKTKYAEIQKEYDTKLPFDV